jgi:hypothetical protein
LSEYSGAAAAFHSTGAVHGVPTGNSVEMSPASTKFDVVTPVKVRLAVAETAGVT